MTIHGLKTRLYKLKVLIIKIINKLIRPICEKNEKKRLSEKGICSIPIIINNYNRYSAFIKLVGWLRSAGFKNIIVLDNQSTYPPLVEYYKNNTNFKLVQLGGNFGHLALWETGYYKKVRNGYFIYTDPDVFPVNECPHDLISYLLDLLWKYPEISKVGPGLRLYDIPDCYVQKDSVVAWETKYWEIPMEKNVFKARIDTTFAVYRPRMMHDAKSSALRTGEPYVMHHAPWYEDERSLSEEEMFYQNHMKKGVSWWSGNGELGAIKVSKGFDFGEFQK